MAIGFSSTRRKHPFSLALLGSASLFFAQPASAGFELTPAETPVAGPRSGGGVDSSVFPGSGGDRGVSSVPLAPKATQKTGAPVVLDMKPLDKPDPSVMRRSTRPASPVHKPSALSADEMTPMPAWEGSARGAPVPAAMPSLSTVSPDTAVTAEKMAPPPQVPLAPSLAATPGPSPGSVNFEGFGRDMPLALAMRQIVPADYAFSFDNGVDPGVRVSWTGGAPWNVVLQNALAPAGLQVTVENKMVVVQDKQPGAGMAPPPAPAPLAPPAASGVPVSLTTPVVPPNPRMQPLMKAPSPAVLPPKKGVEAEALMPMPAPVAASVPAASSMTLPAAQQPAASSSASVPVLPIQGASPPLSEVPARSFRSSEVREWAADSGASLRQTLSKWSREAGVQLYWSSQYDYPLQADVLLNGTYEKAVATLLDGLRDAQPRPLGRLHPNPPDGPAVLVIETRHIIN